MTVSCANCKHSECYTEGQRVGLKCGLDGMHVSPPLYSLPSVGYQAEIDLKAQRCASACHEYYPDV